MNRVVHFEIHADDVERAKKFYTGLFGWEMQQMGSEYGDYVVVVTGPGPDEIAAGKVTMENVGINGGLMKRRGPRPAPDAPVNGYSCIVGVDDVDAMVEKAKGLGATMALDAMDIPNVGRLAYMHDTEGNIFGIIKPAMRQ